MAKIEKYVIAQVASKSNTVLEPYVDYIIFVIDDEHMILDDQVYEFNDIYLPFLIKLPDA